MNYDLDEDYIKKVIWKKYHVTNIHYVIWKRIFLSNPSLYEIIDGVIITPRNFSLEILTFSPRYKELWDSLQKTYPTSQVGLWEMGYDEHLHCYIVDICSPSLLNFIKNVYRMWGENPKSKEKWVNKYG